MKRIQKQAEAFLPTAFGQFRMIAYSDNPNDLMPHVALVHKDFEATNETPIRIHSECMTGDVFASNKCDCGEQLHNALQYISENKGILVYLRQEGRGIGLINKLKAYQLQEKGLNTIDANTHLGFESDTRQYQIAVDILKDLELEKIKLITNNPEKMNALVKAGFDVIDRIYLPTKANNDNYNYLETKKIFMGHFLEIE